MYGNVPFIRPRANQGVITGERLQLVLKQALSKHGVDGESQACDITGDRGLISFFDRRRT